ncbi:MAG: ribulose-phosphate 3-epimerase [Armatimonadetes bacterium]|jgi:ribulose-phosphate 3-epimerase|nr:ribulose-phosphate 3-epimerase [Armatimonadota bacterium]
MQKNNRVQIFPSILAADFGNLSKAVTSLDGSGADAVHCDTMDGRYVPNISFGPMVVKAIKPHTSLPLCCHLMIEEPENYIDAFVDAGAFEISVHAEACVHLHRVIQQIKAAGVLAGVALNPSTPLCMVENVFSDMDMLLVMTVNPGFGGQSFIPEMLPKIAMARQMANELNPDLNIAVDGGIDVKTAPEVVRAGANILIAGSSVFGHPEGVKQACAELRSAFEDA